jgi:hypothetical protein
MPNIEENHQKREKVLKGIALRFASHRRRQGGRRVHASFALKEMVCSAAALGIPAEQLATAAGITSASVRNWLRPMSKKAKPRELVVLNSEAPLLPSASVPSIDDGQRAQITFPSGVRLELAVSSLNPSLISMLGGQS